MSATAANLMDYVLPRHSGLRQWVLTFPFAWRRALARDGALLGSLTRIFEQTVQGFYARRAREEGHLGAKTGSVSVLQLTSITFIINVLRGIFKQRYLRSCAKSLATRN